MGADRRKPAAFNLAEAKKRFSELVSRVAFGGERVLILRRGKLVAKLVPPDDGVPRRHLADVRGWLEEGDPLFEAVDDIVAARAKHRPRVLERRRRGSR